MQQNSGAETPRENDRGYLAPIALFSRAQAAYE